MAFSFFSKGGAVKEVSSWSFTSKSSFGSFQHWSTGANPHEWLPPTGGRLHRVTIPFSLPCVIVLIQLIQKPCSLQTDLANTSNHIIQTKTPNIFSQSPRKRRGTYAAFSNRRSWDFRKGHPKTGYGLRVAGLIWNACPLFGLRHFLIYFTSRILANLNLHGNKKYYLSLLRRYTVNISTNSKYVYFSFRVHICHHCCRSS